MKTAYKRKLEYKSIINKCLGFLQDYSACVLKMKKCHLLNYWGFIYRLENNFQKVAIWLIKKKEKSGVCLYVCSK